MIIYAIIFLFKNIFFGVLSSFFYISGAIPYSSVQLHYTVQNQKVPVTALPLPVRGSGRRSAHLICLCKSRRSPGTPYWFCGWAKAVLASPTRRLLPIENSMVCVCQIPMLHQKTITAIIYILYCLPAVLYCLSHLFIFYSVLLVAFFGRSFCF
jgi:hypothetical protein